MRVRFRKRAEADLRQIVAWYEDLAPESLSNILEDIHSKIEFLRRYPRGGPRIDGTPFRRASARRYRFRIAYEVSEETLTIVGIFRFQDRER